MTELDQTTSKEEAQRKANREFVAGLVDFQRSTVTQGRARLLGWLLAGNVAGLYFLLDRKSTARLPDNINFSLCYGVFFVGACAAVTASVNILVVDQMSKARLTRLLGGYAAQVDAMVHEAFSKQHKELTTLGKAERFVPAFTAISGLMLLVGLSVPFFVTNWTP